MKINMKMVLFGVLLALPVGLSVASLYSACCGNEPFKRSRDLAECPLGNCNYQRGDNRCNVDSDCCPGKRCNSASGQCESC